MPSKKGVVPSGKRPVAAPRSPVAKPKPLKGPATPRPAKKSSASSRKTFKRKRHSHAFSTTKSRQVAVERAKLQIWRHLQAINAAIIRLAESGSYLAAKTLFDFAGVYSLPPLDDTAHAASQTAVEAPGTAPSCPETPPLNKVDAFLQTLGLDPLSSDEPDPDVAA